MIRVTELRLPLGHEDAALRQALVRRLGIAERDLTGFTIFRRAVDARRPKAIEFIYTVDAEVANEAEVLRRLQRDRHAGVSPDTSYRHVRQLAAPPARRPVVIGAGPCGYFAALILAEMGFRPLVLERGKIVRVRTKDTFGFWRKRELNPESNAQFGEGGAGTFSDGKLYSQVKDPRFLGRKVLTEFVAAGAPPEILYVSKPHVGTFRLVSMVEALREKILALGGEFRFETRVEKLIVGKDPTGERRVEGVLLMNGEVIEADQVVLAVGHSARDTFQMLHEQGVYIEAKPFSIGCRIEHPQSVIDRARLGPHAGNKLLGAADYKIVHHGSNGRSVYSFCMCPGGTVVATASEPGRVVTNGMSQYSRAERNANAGIVVGISPADYPGHPLAGIDFQRQWEAMAFAAGGGDYSAPGQLVGDFIAGKGSTALGSVVPSYKPGVTPTDLALCLPDYAIAAMREALPAFGRQIRGFDMHDAVMTGVETRTSSPISIRRGEDFQSINTRGLYPAGEGAGYAGGILSAGIDGIKVAEAVAQQCVELGHSTSR
ncbi:MAG: NAD(P)/FAD-dependent oxidoreductase [Alphaproteobacteria bacterium]